MKWEKDECYYVFMCVVIKSFKSLLQQQIIIIGMTWNVTYNEEQKAIKAMLWYGCGMTIGKRCYWRYNCLHCFHCYLCSSAELIFGLGMVKNILSFPVELLEPQLKSLN